MGALGCSPRGGEANRNSASAPSLQIAAAKASENSVSVPTLQISLLKDMDDALERASYMKESESMIDRCIRTKWKRATIAASAPSLCSPSSLENAGGVTAANRGSRTAIWRAR